MTDFEQFWTAWPSNVVGGYQRKAAKSMCAAKWAKMSYDSQLDTILKHIAWLKTTPDWLNDRGAFIPMPITYLNQQRWDGCEIPEPPVDTAQAALIAIKQREATYTPPSAEMMAKVREATKRIKALHS
jgi:hypothetical protein